MSLSDTPRLQSGIFHLFPMLPQDLQLLIWHDEVKRHFPHTFFWYPSEDKKRPRIRFHNAYDRLRFLEAPGYRLMGEWHRSRSCCWNPRPCRREGETDWNLFMTLQERGFTSMTITTRFCLDSCWGQHVKKLCMPINEIALKLTLLTEIATPPTRLLPSWTLDVVPNPTGYVHLLGTSSSIHPRDLRDLMQLLRQLPCLRELTLTDDDEVPCDMGLREKLTPDIRRWGDYRCDAGNGWHQCNSFSRCQFLTADEQQMRNMVVVHPIPRVTTGKMSRSACSGVCRLSLQGTSTQATSVGMGGHRRMGIRSLRR